jgi:hypothetical protein
MSLQVAIPVAHDRTFPPTAWQQAAKALESSGAVDQIQTWDQLTSWFPHSMWTTENTPLADCDSFSDAFAMAVYALAVAPNLGEVISTDLYDRNFPPTTTERSLVWRR